MEKEYVMEIARTIREQLVSLTPMPVLMSWGVEGFAATVYKDMPALQTNMALQPMSSQYCRNSWYPNPLVEW